MPAGRKSGKGSSAQAKSNGKAASTSTKAGTASSLTVVEREEEKCQTLRHGSPDNDLEGLDDARLSDLSADEPELSECE